MRDIVVPGLLLTIAATVTLAGQQATPQKEDLKGVYQRIVRRVQESLPPHSGLPPTIDLTHPQQALPGAGRAWEDRFKGWMASNQHPDPGLTGPAGPGSISTTIIEWVGRFRALPAHTSDAVVVATPTASSAHFAYNQSFVYTSYNLDVSTVLKGSEKNGIKEHERITCTQLGGIVRYPSGHVEAFLFANEGFLELNKPYYLFLWKPLRSEDIYTISEAYLIQDGLVFPILTDADVSA